jgi:uncharacterized protein YnzC (UPF0291/DUF896 family)
MITKELLDRINELARKQREERLTEEEIKEQGELRELYLAGIRAQVVNALESKGCKPKKTEHNNSCSGDSCGKKH